MVGIAFVKPAAQPRVRLERRNNMADKYYCKNCNSTKDGENFYLSNNLEKYPEGKVDLCKKCMTLHVDNWDPQTYLWILQEVDVPYIPDEWNKLLASYGKDRSKLTGLTILGRYLSKMKLKQYRDFRWADTEHLQDVANSKIEATMIIIATVLSGSSLVTLNIFTTLPALVTRAT